MNSSKLHNGCFAVNIYSTLLQRCPSGKYLAASECAWVLFGNKARNTVRRPSISACRAIFLSKPRFALTFNIVLQYSCWFAGHGRVGVDRWGKVDGAVRCSEEAKKKRGGESRRKGGGKKKKKKKNQGTAATDLPLRHSESLWSIRSISAPSPIPLPIPPPSPPSCTPARPAII